MIMVRVIEIDSEVKELQDKLANLNASGGSMGSTVTEIEHNIDDLRGEREMLMFQYYLL